MAGTFQVKEVGGVRDTEIECSDPTLGGSHEPYAVAFDKMRRSVFCLVLPGDAQSTRRLSEIFLAGCVPVFIGLPTHKQRRIFTHRRTVFVETSFASPHRRGRARQH